MWRNGRRNGLKIRLSENSVWVRVPPSALSEMRFHEGKSSISTIQTVANGRARKCGKSQSICQVFTKHLLLLLIRGRSAARPIPGPRSISGSRRGQRDADAIFTFKLNSDNGAAHTVNANGTAIRGATIVFDDLGNSALSLGTVLTVIDNTSANAIMGTFSNLANGSTLTVGSNTFQANYEGGDGNDLTLTVVP